MEESFSSMSLRDDEVEGWELPESQGSGIEPEVHFNEFSLVGRFLTDKTINFTAMKNRLASI